MNRKISAFTVFEVLVAMLLAALCAGICYQVYRLSERYFSDFSRKAGSQDQLAMLVGVLSRDAETSRFILRTDSGISCKTDSAVVSYRFDQERVIRTQVKFRSDTFNFKLTAPEMLYKGQEAGLDSLVDAVSLVALDSLKRRIPIQISKVYGATDLFK